MSNSKKVCAPSAAKQNQGTNSQAAAVNTSIAGVSGQAMVYLDTCGLLPDGKQPVEALIPWEQPVPDMGNVAQQMADTISRHCILSKEEVDAIVLWIISSYLINRFRVYPKLTLISPEKRCGKTTTLEVVKSMVRDGLMTSNLSPAVFYRLTEFYQVTLLIDEADTFVKGADPHLNGLINSSHTKSGASILRCDGDDNQPKVFSTWMPMLLASIGSLPDTIMDRSITINLRRKKCGETTERLPVDLYSVLYPLRQKIARWCLDNAAIIETNIIEPVDIGNDRAVDNWLPLFTIAALIGQEWQNRCEAAYKALTDVPVMEQPTQLLHDIREILEQYGEAKITTQELIDRLCDDPSGIWGEANRGKAITGAYMAKLLKPYNISPATIRFSSEIKRGYEKQQFQDAFDRYLA